MGGGITKKKLNTLGSIIKSQLLNNNNSFLLIDPNLVEKLERNNIKFNKKELILVTMDQTGQIVFLEKGDMSRGFEHIIQKHFTHFEKKFGICDKDELLNLLYSILSNGVIIKQELKPLPNGKLGYEKVYNYQGNNFILAGVGTNGYIVSMYPIKEEK